MLVLLDRDGVLNRDMKTGVLRLEDFDILSGAPEALATLTKAGFKLAICTNQSAVGRGQLSVATLDTIHAKLQQAVREAGGHIDAIYYAPDTPEKPTLRRKPGPGMLQEALAQFHATPSETFMVGDHLRDMQAAHAAGCRGILVRTGHGRDTEANGLPAELQVIVKDDITQAAEYILSHSAGASPQPILD